MRKIQKVLFVNPFPIVEIDYKDYAKIYTLNSSSPVSNTSFQDNGKDKGLRLIARALDVHVSRAVDI